MTAIAATALATVEENFKPKKCFFCAGDGDCGDDVSYGEGSGGGGSDERTDRARKIATKAATAG